MIIALSTAGCATYVTLEAERAYVLNRPAVRADKRGYPVRVTVTKYLARLFPETPAAAINNRAVDCLLAGRTEEAAVLLAEAFAEGAGAAAANNLGVTSEMLGDRAAAFRMYLTACMLEPNNERFRRNLISFEGSRIETRIP